MNRIVVIGCAGSGKSTLSQKLGEIYKLPVIHLDKFYWKPSWVESPKDEWDQTVEAFTKKDQWIIDGNYARTMEQRLERADLVIFLDMPRWLCLYRVLKRRVIYHKKTRPDMNEGCPEKIDFEFMKWVWNYRKRSRGNILTRLENVKGQKEVLIVKTRKTAEEILRTLEHTSKKVHANIDEE